MYASDRLGLAAWLALAASVAGCNGTTPGATPASTSPSSASAPMSAAQPAASQQAGNRQDGSATAAVAIPAATASASAPPAAVDFGTRVLNQPDNLQVKMLAYRIAGKTPPLAEWAEKAVGKRYVDEFQRPAALQQEQERLQAVWDGTAGVGWVRFNVNANFSEYDATRGGYYFDAFTPGSYFTFGDVRLGVDNMGELNFWPLDAASAQDVLRRNGSLRNVVLDSLFRITGASQRGDAQEISLQLQRYTITSDRYGQQGTVLGERVFGQ